MGASALSMFLQVITIFILAVFLGVELINKVPSLLHTPLMSGSNAISGITVVGAIMTTGLAQVVVEPGAKIVVLVLGVASLVFATINVVGGFVVTNKMLSKFKPRKQLQKPAVSGETSTKGGSK